MISPALLPRLLARHRARRLAGKRLLLLAAPEDRHHVELCFLRYLDRLAGPQGPRWRLVPYVEATPADLAGSDLAIFCRPRFPECPPLLDDCLARGLRTLVMIDDNWIAAGEEYPRYRALFAPGCAPLATFLEAVRRADATLVYNDVLATDLAPHARRLVRLPTNVDLSLFVPPVRVPPPGGRLRLGYAGSPRFEPSAFAALAELALARADLDLFFFGHELPPELAGLPAQRLRFLPHVRDYAAYAATLSGLCPDILIAPLDATRFSASKCPNKPLEIAAAGAAGVYSDVPPYRGFVVPERTGLLVDNSLPAWHRALERLCDDAPLRRRIVARSRRQVRRSHSTEAVLPRFVRLLAALLAAPPHPTSSATLATYAPRE